MTIKPLDLTEEQKRALLQQFRSQIGHDAYLQLSSSMNDDAIIAALLAQAQSSQSDAAASKPSHNWAFYIAFLLAMLAGIAFPDGDGFKTVDGIFSAMYKPVFLILFGIMAFITLLGRGDNPLYACFWALLIVLPISLIGGFAVNLYAHGIWVIGMAIIVFLLSCPALAVGVSLMRFAASSAHWALRFCAGLVATALLLGGPIGACAVGEWALRLVAESFGWARWW
jgi:hypothetical protein